MSLIVKILKVVFSTVFIFVLAGFATGGIFYLFGCDPEVCNAATVVAGLWMGLDSGAREIGIQFRTQPK